MLVASDVGPQCTGCMDEEAREVQQAQKLESVKDVCSGMQCEPGSDHTVGIWVMLPYGVLPGCTLLLLLLFIPVCCIWNLSVLKLPNRRSHHQITVAKRCT